MAKGGVHGKGGMHGKRGCMAKGGLCGKGGHVWQRGACMAKGGMRGEGGVHDERGEACMVCTLPFYEIWLVNARAVRILLECILV